MQQRFKRLLQLASIIASSLFLSPCALAQITPDGSLPTPTEVESSGNDFTINGGTTAGNNLFHSFTDFSVPVEGSAIFNNASDASNIINRVTGGNISEINGLIRSDSGANLFLLNPAGIIFGAGSSLDIGGSFYGSTGQSILFPDGVEFDANPAIEPILTINAPIGFNVREDSGNIVNRSVVEGQPDEFGFAFPVGLAVTQGQSITLEANQIRFESGLLTAPGGSINLRALSEIAIAGNTLDFALDTSSDIGNGGAIEIDSDNGMVVFNDAIVRSNAINSGNGGQINIFAQGALVFADTTIDSIANVSGEGGDVSLESATSISLIDTRIDTGAFGNQRSGDIRISALNGGAIEFIGRENEPAEILADAFGSGEGLEENQTGGDLTILGGDITIDNYRLVSVVNPSDPDNFAGNFNLNTSGNGGDITIAGRNIAIANSTLETLTEGEGTAGSITIEGQRLNLDNAQIEASNRPPSTITEDSDSVGGNINLRLDRLLSLRNNSSIVAGAENNASGGNIEINSQFIVAFPSSGSGNDLVADAEAGRGGNINISSESIFNLEQRDNQPNNGTNDIDVSSELGVDGNVMINTLLLNQFESIVALSVSLIDSEQAIASSCEAETGRSQLAIKGKGGIPEAPDAPLRTENIYVEDTNNSRESIKSNPHNIDNSSGISVETDNGKINLAMGAIVRKDGTVSLVGKENQVATHKQTSGLVNCL